MMGLVLRHIHFQTKKTSSPDKTQYRDPRQTRRRLNPYSLAIVVAVARPYTPRRESNFCPQSLGPAPTAQIHGRGPTHRLAGATARGFVRNPSSEAWLVVREARRAIHPRISAEHSGCKNGEPKLGHHRQALAAADKVRANPLLRFARLPGTYGVLLEKLNFMWDYHVNPNVRRRGCD